MTVADVPDIPLPAEGYVALANALNNMRISILVIVSVVGLVAFGMWLWSRHMSQKVREDEATKRHDAEDKHTTALSRLGAAVEHMSQWVDALQREQAATSDAVVTSLAKTGTLVRSLANKINGRVNLNDSVRIVSHAFEKIVFREVCIVLEHALRENDYENRKDYVERKIKTQVGEVLADIRETLASYPLGLDIRTYFPIDTSAPGERFILCQSLWDRIAPLFMGKTPVAHRIEEAFLLIENTVRDHVMSCYRQIVEIVPQTAPTPAAGKVNPTSRSALRTPLPIAEGDTDLGLRTQHGGEFSRPGEPSKNMLRRLGKKP